MVHPTAGRISRRRLLETALVTGPFAGCLGSSGTETPTSQASATDGFATPTATPALNVSEGQVTVGSVGELIRASSLSDTTITMQPGEYAFRDYFTPDRIKIMQNTETWQYLNFDGNGNDFDFTDATFNFDTTLREQLNPPRGPEIVVSGDNNTFTGLEIVNHGNGVNAGGPHLSVRGNGNRFVDMTLTVRGSKPYGYGDLLGKGGSPLVPLGKKSAFQIWGDDTRVEDSTIHQRALGHAYFIQSDATGVHFENCIAQGKMRSTDDMLAETSGPAYENDFKMVMKNAEGEAKIPPGYKKSLAEAGFRTYADASEITCVDCEARNMRIGWALFSASGYELENCRALGNESGIWLGGDSPSATGCRVNAKFGPAFIIGNNQTWDLELSPETSEFTVHATGVIRGGQETDIRIRRTGESSDDAYETLPSIKLGYNRNGSNNIFKPFDSVNSGTSNCEIINETTVPIEVSAPTEDCRIITAGEVRGDSSGNEVRENFTEFDAL